MAYLVVGPTFKVKLGEPVKYTDSEYTNMMLIFCPALYELSAVCMSAEVTFVSFYYEKEASGGAKQ